MHEANKKEIKTREFMNNRFGLTAVILFHVRGTPCDAKKGASEREKERAGDIFLCV